MSSDIPSSGHADNKPEISYSDLFVPPNIVEEDVENRSLFLSIPSSSRSLLREHNSRWSDPIPTRSSSSPSSEVPYSKTENSSTSNGSTQVLPSLALSNCSSSSLYEDGRYRLTTMEYTSICPTIYKRLSKFLASVAYDFAQRPQGKQWPEESSALISAFYRFSIRCDNIARLLAESQEYRMRVIFMLHRLGISPSDFHELLQQDEDDISQLIQRLLTLPDSTNLVLSVLDNPCQAQDLLNLFDERLAHSMSQRAGDDQLGQHPFVSPAQPDGILDRSKLLRRVIKLAFHSGLMPSSLYLTSVKLESQDRVAGGAFADIYEGNWHNQPVAIKRLRFFMVQTEEKRISTCRMFCTEALLWKYVDHPNVLPFLGINNSLFPGNSSLCMVSPWMTRGNVREYLNTLKYEERAQEVLRLIKEIACGLSFLHSDGLVHGDLRGPNVLIGDDKHARVADFGLASFAEATSGTSSSTMSGATAWMAPELHNPAAFGLSHPRATIASDIYSFGCLFWELYANNSPFYPLKGFQLFQSVLNKSRPPQSSETHNIPDDVWAVMNKCWMHEPQGRPNAIELQALLGQLSFVRFPDVQDSLARAYSVGWGRHIDKPPLSKFFGRVMQLFHFASD